MENNINMPKYELIFVIVDCGLGSKVLKTAKKSGVPGGTILLAKGTVRNHLLEILGVNNIKREIVLMIAEEKTAMKALEGLNERFDFKKPDSGIAFSTTVMSFLGAGNCEYNKTYEGRGVKNIMYNAVFTIVDRGKAEAVVDAAISAGSKGATIINARGSGIDEKSVLFSIVVEPEKEIVMILTEKDLTDTIVSSVRETMKIDEPGKGIMFVLNINKIYGLYSGKE
jgi:nitrogen regulatory protein PII